MSTKMSFNRSNTFASDVSIESSVTLPGHLGEGGHREYKSSIVSYADENFSEIEEITKLQKNDSGNKRNSAKHSIQRYSTVSPLVSVSQAGHRLVGSELSQPRFKRTGMVTTFDQAHSEKHFGPFTPLEENYHFDSEDSDQETTLDLSDRRRVYDHDAAGRRLYLQQCEKIGVIPISVFMRKIAEQEMNLRDRQCGPKGAEALAAPLLINTCITALDLGGNGIGDEGIQRLVSALIDNTYVETLSLAENGLKVEGARAVSRLMEHNTIITSLDISGNDFGDDVAEFLTRIFEDSKKLVSLDISNNKLGEKVGMAIGPAIGFNDTLFHLNLSWNHFRTQGAIAITQGIKENVRLTKVNLSWNGLGFEGGKALGGALAENRTLKELDIISCRINDAAAFEIAKGLQKNDEGLEKLVMHHNPITYTGALGLLKAVSDNENTALCLLDIKDVLVKEQFQTLLQDLQSTTQKKLQVTAIWGAKQNHKKNSVKTVSPASG